MRILIVEDDPKQLMPLQTVLSQAGHSVNGVKDGETAQWLLSEKDYDFLILDWMLPRVSGVNLYRHGERHSRSRLTLYLRSLLSSRHRAIAR